MYLVKGNGSLGLKSKLSPDPAAQNISVKGNTPFVTPWRLFILGSDPGTLIESNLIMNLNEPSRITNTDWIKPGSSTWSWWAENRGFEPSFAYSILADNTIKYYIDFASRNNIEYVTLDGGWYGWFDAEKDISMRDLTKTLPELNLPSIAQYASSKNVGLILWATWSDISAQMESALDYFSSLGIKGIKVDFMERDDQEMVDFYTKLAEECAERKIFINFHGSYKPDGLARTYPNILTYEGVLGNEYARWITGLPHPDYTIMLPFTRMIAGPMDYTPGSMTNSTDAAYIGRWLLPMTKGTRAQQMAMTVVFETGILTLCESPMIYEKLPEFNFIKQVPARWDSTIVLDSKIGDYIIIARKNGDKWFIGGMTDWKSRNVNVNFGFLENGEYECGIYEDANDADTNPGNVKISNITVNNSFSQSFRLAKGGGLAIVLKKK
jgi:alpha-glucosidase